MAMFDSNIDYTKFIQFTDQGGLRVATYPEIVNALSERYKQIYGNDIDTSSVSADGQFINSIALIINNICSTFSFAFKQMNPNTATGRYLDVLASYNNLERRNSTNSTATLWIYNNSNTDITGTNLSFKDNDGNIWEWICPVGTSGSLITFPANTATVIEGVKCQTNGSINAYGSSYSRGSQEDIESIFTSGKYLEYPGSINQFIDIQNNLLLWQEKTAEVGTLEESDEALRSRRNELTSINSVSILEGLRSALININGIKECFIYNNNTSTSKTLVDEPIGDSTTVPAHSIYIALRYEKNAEVPDAIIGETIYNKLTPGVGTTPKNKSFEYNYMGINYTINWKKCEETYVDGISLTFITNSNYDYPSALTKHTASNNIERSIVNGLLNYINNVRIDSYLSVADMLMILQQSDILKNGASTLFPQSGVIGSSDTIYGASLGYFDFSNDNITFTYNTTNHTCTIDITKEE